MFFGLHNSTKLTMKEDINVLYQVFILRVNQKTKMVVLASDRPRRFWLLCNYWTKFDRNQDLDVICQICVFWTDRKTKMATLASHLPRHFRLLCNRRTEFNETWQEARSRLPLPSLCFSGCSENQYGHLVENFSTSDWLVQSLLLHFLARRDKCPESYYRTPSVGVRVHKNFNLAYSS